MLKNKDAESSKKNYSLADFVYHKIFSRISSGEFKPHSKLPSENELAKSLKVSRTIVRLALKRLREDGLVYSRQGSGSFVEVNPNQTVAGFTPIGSIADIQRGYEFRISIERDAAFLAAQRANTAAIREIEAALKRQSEAALMDDFYIEADLDFHTAIAKATNNSFYVQVLNSIRGQLSAAMKIGGGALHGPNPSLDKVIKEHEKIFTAIRDRDPKTAKEAMRYHIESARNRVFENKLLDLSMEETEGAAEAGDK